MAIQMKQPYTTSAPAIATYDYEDIVSGQKFVQLYLSATNDTASGTEYTLTNSNTYTSSIETTTSTSLSMNFDTTPLNFSRTIKGTALFNFGAVGTAGGAAETVTATLQKWDGSSATNITSAIAVTLDTAGAQTIYAFKMPCTETLIREGEQIRLNIAMSAAGGGESATFGHSPTGRTGTILTSANTITSSRIKVPFRVEF